MLETVTGIYGETKSLIFICQYFNPNKAKAYNTFWNEPMLMFHK